MICPTLKPVMLLRGHTGEVNCVDACDEIFEAVSGGEDKTLRIWNLIDGACICVVDVGTPVKAVCYCKHDIYGIKIIAACGDGFFRFYNPNGEPCELLNLQMEGGNDSDDPEHIRIFSNIPETCDIIFCAKKSISCQLRYSRDGEPWKTPWNLPNIGLWAVVAIAVDSDCGWFVAADAFTFAVWSLSNNDPFVLQTLRYCGGLPDWLEPDPLYEVKLGSDKGSIESLATCGDRIIVGLSGGSITVWGPGAEQLQLVQEETESVNGYVSPITYYKTKQLELIQELNGHIGRIVCLSADENLLLSGSWDYTLRLWDIASGKCLSIMDFPRTPEGNLLNAVALVRGTKTMALSAHCDGTVQVWDITSVL